MKPKRVYPIRPLKERFEEKIFYSPCGCWYWIGASGKSKYGVIRAGDSNCQAHRVAYELYKGKIPSGFWVCHQCDNPYCVNPDHLFLGRPIDNIHDMHRKGRAFRKISLNDHDEIKRLNKTLSCMKISKMYGVGASSIFRVIKNQYKRLIK